MNFLDARLPKRFWAKCTPIPFCGCWIWHGTVNDAGYGMIRHEGRNQFRAHRLAYLTLVGEIPDGLELDHRVCQTRCCVNPAHLEAVTHAVNMARGRASIAWATMQRAKTHCPRGHEYSKTNTYTAPTGKRNCRQCGRDRVNESNRIKREARRPL